jgi:hypothetical protein
MRCKQELTLLYVDHLCSNYRDIKNSIDLNMLALENTLNEDQFQEVFDYLKAGYKLAGPKAVTKVKHAFKANTQGSRVFKKGRRANLERRKEIAKPRPQQPRDKAKKSQPKNEDIGNYWASYLKNSKLTLNISVSDSY